MALHTELPIHKVAYDLAGLTVDLVKNMPREVKAVIGGELRDECLKLIVLIFRANVATDKRAHLAELVERLQVAELLLRLSRDKRYISTGQYASAIALTGSIGKTAGVPVFVKQLGAIQIREPNGPAWARPFGGKDRAGADPSEWPSDLRVRQFPT